LIVAVLLLLPLLLLLQLKACHYGLCSFVHGYLLPCWGCVHFAMWLAGMPCVHFDSVNASAADAFLPSLCPSNQHPWQASCMIMHMEQGRGEQQSRMRHACLKHACADWCLHPQKAFQIGQLCCMVSAPLCVTHLSA
jgi:hypothetical protein